MNDTLDGAELVAQWRNQGEQHNTDQPGATWTILRLGPNAFTPGLLPGLGGVAYQLLRANPEHDLPSILTPGGEDLLAARPGKVLLRTAGTI